MTTWVMPPPAKLPSTTLGCNAPGCGQRRITMARTDIGDGFWDFVDRAAQDARADGWLVVSSRVAFCSEHRPSFWTGPMPQAEHHEALCHMTRAGVLKHWANEFMGATLVSIFGHVGVFPEVPELPCTCEIAKAAMQESIERAKNNRW